MILVHAVQDEIVRRFHFAERRVAVPYLDRTASASFFPFRGTVAGGFHVAPDPVLKTMQDRPLVRRFRFGTIEYRVVVPFDRPVQHDAALHRKGSQQRIVLEINGVQAVQKPDRVLAFTEIPVQELAQLVLVLFAVRIIFAARNEMVQLDSDAESAEVFQALKHGRRQLGKTEDADRFPVVSGRLPRSAVPIVFACDPVEHRGEMVSFPVLPRDAAPELALPVRGRFAVQSLRRQPGFPVVDPPRTVQHVFIIELTELAGQVVQALGIPPDPLRQQGELLPGTRFPQDPVNAPADRFPVDARTVVSLRQETLENRHQRGKFELCRNAIPMRETERKVSLNAPVRDDDPRPAEKIAVSGFSIDLVKQHVREGVHARSAENGRFFEMFCLVVLHHTFQVENSGWAGGIASMAEI